MPKFLKSVKGLIITPIVGEVKPTNLVDSRIGGDDYAKLFTIVKFYQDLSFAHELEVLDSPQNFGLTNNTTFTELNISY